SSDSATTIRPTPGIAASSLTSERPGWAPETRDRCIDRYRWPTLASDYRVTRVRLSSADQIRNFRNAQLVGSWTIHPVRSMWRWGQRRLRVAEMGRLLARLFGQIRKYRLGIVAAAGTVARVVLGPAQRWESRLLDRLS